MTIGYSIVFFVCQDFWNVNVIWGMGQNYICPVVIVLGNIKRGTDLLGAETIYRVNKRVMVEVINALCGCL